MGTPAVTLHFADTFSRTEDGRSEGPGKRTTRSQEMFLARSPEVESCFGRIIQRTTREIKRGAFSVVEYLRVVRKEGREVVGLRERRCSVQSGILVNRID